ncbi:unnamed protein product [Dovyalis caffra]|uniref:Uncharacterized protein n=1 Tax=Dovyalis caffra TaxID=77055 RepID=A0AAV1SKI8_9ROSI|nr:unnamed protein product [Dovyalis caffra]
MSFCEGGWAASLSHHFSRTADVVLRGYSGYNTRWALKGAERIFPPVGSGGAQPSAFTVFFGANDASLSDRYAAFQHVPLHEYKQNLHSIISFFKQWNMVDLVVHVLFDVFKLVRLYGSLDVVTEQNILGFYFGRFVFGLKVARTQLHATLVIEMMSSCSRSRHQLTYNDLPFGPLQPLCSLGSGVGSQFAYRSVGQRLSLSSLLLLQLTKMHASENPSGLPERTNEAAGAYAKACISVAKECGCPAVDLWTKMQEFPDWQKAYLSDGLHLTQTGNRFVFEEVVKILKEQGISPENLPVDLPLFANIDPNDPLKAFQDY